MQDIGVVYLCRHQEGEAPVRAFLESYRRFPAGKVHDLHVLFKGYPNSRELEKARALFNDTALQSIEIDDAQFDISSYLHAAKVAANRRLLFLNTFSQILAPNWLAHFDNALSQPGVGIAGATGSWQANASGYERAFKILLGKIRNMPADMRSRLALNGSQPQDAVSQTTEDEQEQFKRKAYRYLIAPFLYLYNLYEYGRFPNPHIRTNAFMIERDVFLSLRFPRRETKAEMYKFESGRHSITRQILALGLRPVVVDRLGNVHHIAEWRSSSTFWFNDQINLLVSDNRSRAYTNGTTKFRKALETSAWSHPWHAD